MQQTVGKRATAYPLCYVSRFGMSQGSEDRRDFGTGDDSLGLTAIDYKTDQSLGLAALRGTILIFDWFPDKKLETRISRSFRQRHTAENED